MNGKFGGGNGSYTSPYLIEDADDLNAIRNYPSSYFKMVNDINLGNGKYNTGQGWNPIRDFTGFLEGNNHKIMNLYINRSTENFVGFFRNFYSKIQNIMFTNPEIIGHDYVGVVCGYFMTDTWNETGKGTGFDNVSVIQGQIKGHSNVGGFGGLIAHGAKAGYIHYVNSIFVDATIISEDGVAYGIGRDGNDLTCSKTGRHRNDFSTRIGNWNGFWANCDCNCNCPANGWNCHDQFSYNSVLQYKNCITKLHKDPSVITYYALSNNVHCTYNGCYTDKSQFTPIVGTGIEYANLYDVQYPTNSSAKILQNINKDLFTSELASSVEPINLNKNSIYFKTKDGYVIYNFTTKEWEIKYKRLTNQNSAKIIQNGMSRTDLPKIPVSKLKELQDENITIKIVNCINAHEKIVSKTEVVEVNKFKEYLDKNIFRNKIKFDKYNDKIMNIIKK